MSLDVAALRASAHPIRLRMLSLLTGAAMSATELAQELDITHANASYHLRVLAAAGIVEAAGEENVRGGVVKRYRHPTRTAADECAGQAVGTDPEGQLLVWQAIAHELIRRAQDQAVDTERPSPSALCDAELWVDPEVWKRAVRLAGDAALLLHENAQPPRTDGTLHVNATMALFEMTTKEPKR
ncbi:ArsR/SmtB family transcription factor [Actinopolymorpha pittospori]|uniref:DNA-binding transcriptional ArsR family regulator n=1 Tax=Actinopolymorpha pittospori TaxID=648752 RepID=A0A927R944_9ACTN|nr:metalloregulator ArsR/SmtB family transcription factor [Actinopolymorpha pittospori]MBE1606094.1 DNA-binding transcriptional ArsR family regulator [Actinopolymorpha pittospori]